MKLGKINVTWYNLIVSTWTRVLETNKSKLLQPTASSSLTINRA
jgi:hypothetical protein